MTRMKLWPGKLIALEGLDGSGTTTQASLLASGLRAQGYQVLATREPSDGPIGALIRQVLTGRVSLPWSRKPLSNESLALLYAADRMDHLTSTVLSALESGKVVISERYLMSSLAYQGLTLPTAWLETINGYALPADATLFLLVAPATAARRRHERGAVDELFEDTELQSRIAEKYQNLVNSLRPRGSMFVLDGELPPDVVSAQALEVVLRVLHG